MSIFNWSEFNSLPHYLRDEAMPYALPIIVNVEKDETLQPFHEDALIATAKGIVSFFNDERIVDGEWAEPTAQWLKGRIRKVARRARGAAWDKAVELGGIVTTFETATVLILPPHAVEAPPTEVKKLQVAGLDLKRKPLRAPASEVGLFLTLNPDIPMTTGKSLAQIGHAAQIAIFNSNDSQLAAWEAQGFPIELSDWEQFSNWTAEIQDAGFTEVPAGSLTAKSVLV